MKRIVIVDFGGQYAHLIARRIRECGVYSEIHQPNAIPHDDDVVGIIFSGGPRSVTEEDLLSVKLDITSSKVPLLGICYGHQLIAKLMGGTVVSHEQKEYGREFAECNTSSPLFSGTAASQQVWMSHGDSVAVLPPGFTITASTPSTPVAGYQHADRSIFGVQFHPEVTHSEEGMRILQNFVSLCSSEKNWNSSRLSNAIINSIRNEAGNKKLLLLISGGVDSLVALALCIKAVGSEQVFAVHVDTGFMRYRESEEVMEFLQTLGFTNLKLVDAGELFFAKLAGITAPEEKRKIIGGLFVQVMHKALSELNLPPEDWMLVQGTIYPDTIESGGTTNASAIKTHHNRVKEIDDLIAGGKVIEPLKELYKDEVRAVGNELGLPPALVQRRPFPGPGLAIRILTGEGNDSADVSEEQTIIQFANTYGYTARLLPVRSVGVQGDFRTYRHPVLIYPTDGTTFNWDTLLECARLMVNKFKTINRVVYCAATPPDLHSAPVTLQKDRVTLLQQVDNIVQTETRDIAEIWQLPVVSLPLFTSEGKQVFVLRPICSQDAMTADVYQMQPALLGKITDEIVKITGAGLVFYDVTTKPPATIEWE